MQHLSVESSALIKTAYKADWSELTNRVARIASVYVLCNIILWYYYDKIWVLLLTPIQRVTGITVVVLSLSSPFFRTFELIAWISMGVIAPYACIEGLFFIRPGLYRQEQYLSVLMTIIFLSIFYMGQLFSWLYLLPWSLSFFMSFNQLIAEPLLDFDRVVDYMMMFQKVFIIVATWPIVLVGAMRYGFVTPQQLRNLRGMVYVGTFIAGMLLTPPDCFAQCCVALPLIAVYELIILVSFLFV